MAHLTTNKYLNSSNIMVYLNDFAVNMVNKYGYNISIPILIVGGSAIALKGGYRDATVDIDSYIKFNGNVSEAINYVANKNNIFPDWLNQDFAYSESYSRRLEDKAIFYKTLQGIVHIYLVCDIDQLCMKATAFRKKDLPDIKYLVCQCIKQGLVFDDFLNNFYYLYGDSVRLKLDAKDYIRKVFKKLSK